MKFLLRGKKKCSTFCSDLVFGDNFFPRVILLQQPHACRSHQTSARTKRKKQRPLFSLFPTGSQKCIPWMPRERAGSQSIAAAIAHSFFPIIGAAFFPWLSSAEEEEQFAIMFVRGVLFSFGGNAAPDCDAIGPGRQPDCAAIGCSGLPKCCRYEKFSKIPFSSFCERPS